MYPEDSIQAVSGASDWWVQDAKHEIRRGSLIYAFVPHVDQLPYTVEPVGRRQPDQHTAAEVKIAPLVIPNPSPQGSTTTKPSCSGTGLSNRSSAIDGGGCVGSPMRRPSGVL